MIPMEELEGRMSADAHYQLVVNAVDGGMNTLRVRAVLPRACCGAWWVVSAVHGGWRWRRVTRRTPR